MEYLLIFDIPKGQSIMRVKVNRLLKSIGARKVQSSVWSSENLRELTKIAVWIRNAGGNAQIIEERIIY
jgi:CRISPR-associated endonuclease Cas2